METNTSSGSLERGPGILHVAINDADTTQWISEHVGLALAEWKSGELLFLADEAFLHIKRTEEQSAEDRIEWRSDLLAKLNGLPQYITTIHLHFGESLEEKTIADVIRVGSTYVYAFDKYKKEKKTTPELKYFASEKQKAVVSEYQNLAKLTALCRDLVNEPYSMLNTRLFGERIKEQAELYQLHYELFTESKIQSLKMGGLQAVNKGSTEPPLFAVLEYHPKNPRNRRPIVLVGKGIVYDSGGLSLKPTANSMDMMKCDMSGAALVLSAILACAANSLPIHVQALIPLTDNMPGPDAIAPGDVIQMHNGSWVEIMNTDAEGRLILADALSFASKSDPSLVIDFATLTGAAQRAIGDGAMVGMGTAGTHIKQAMQTAAEESGERWVEFPLWKSYENDLKSSIADLKNLGGANAGAITAGKFLQHFTDYPWMHFDIAGPSFYQSPKGEYPAGGTAFGLQFIYQYLKHYGNP